LNHHLPLMSNLLQQKV